MNERAIGRFLRKRLDVDADFARARFSQPTAGTSLWVWKDVPGATRWKTFAFKDADGATVLMSILKDKSSSLAEIELWRGDSRCIQEFPDPSSITEIDKAGVVKL
jgi:hypothetical protein